MVIPPPTILLSSGMEMGELGVGVDEVYMHLLIGPAPKIAPAPRVNSIKAATKLTASYLLLAYRSIMISTIGHVVETLMEDGLRRKRKETGQFRYLQQFDL